MFRKSIVYCGIAAPILYVITVIQSQGVQMFGFFERITIGTYEIWLFVTALSLLKIMQRDL